MDVRKLKRMDVRMRIGKSLKQQVKMKSKYLNK